MYRQPYFSSFFISRKIKKIKINKFSPDIDCFLFICYTNQELILLDLANCTMYIMKCSGTLDTSKITSTVIFVIKFAPNLRPKNVLYSVTPPNFKLFFLLLWSTCIFSNSIFGLKLSWRRQVVYVSSKYFWMLSTGLCSRFLEKHFNYIKNTFNGHFE